MNDRLPTEFETKVLKRMTRPDAYKILAGDKMVAISAACRRLEKLGYAAKPGTNWYVTDKGEKYLAEIAAAVEHPSEIS
jgi:ribosomal protein S19E (S16A)